MASFSVDLGGKKLLISASAKNIVRIRVSDKFKLEMHVDTDDANAVGIKNGSIVKVIKE